VTKLIIYIKIKTKLMQISNTYSKSKLSIISVFIFLISSGCSTANKTNSTDDLSNIKKQIAVIALKPASKAIEHSHLSNPCTAELSHSHIFEKAEHKHKYDCENTNEFVNNAHIHPPAKGHRKYRHVHPNGVNKHSHQR
jgi:hypothetical protein